MQISNSTLSQFVSSSNQQNRSIAKPVTIEGQLVDNDKTRDAEKKTIDSVLEHSGNESQTQLIRPPPAQKPGSGDFNKTLALQEASQELLQKSQNDQSAPSYSAQTYYSAQNNLLQDESFSNSFPFANRRSFEGLAGSSLVIQKYLNNEPSIPNQSVHDQGNINIFI